MTAQEIAAHCGMTESQFSKARRESAGGGRLSELIDKLPAVIRHGYGERLTEQDHDAMMQAAAESLVHAAVRFVSLARKRSAKAQLR